jgi:hypothetical protein
MKATIHAVMVPMTTDAKKMMKNYPAALSTS